MNEFRVEITSSPFAGEAGRRNLDDCARRAAELGFAFGVQLHNTISAPEVVALSASGVRLSAHLPIQTDIMLNLAAEPEAPVRRRLDENLARMRRLGIADGVFHGFLMTDRPIPTFGGGRSYDRCMREIFRPELSLDGFCRLNRDFTGLPEFALRRERVRTRLAELRRRVPEMQIRIENDFPAYGAANLLAADAAALEHPICLDTSHLWATCHLFDRDYHEEAEAFLASGRVTMVHLHASAWDDSHPKTEWGDGHLPLRHPNRMDLPRLVRACREAGVRYFVLEIVRATPDDLDALAEFLA